jgi:catechol 2,3-dioxygenase-like lactoylglutathione lyase family enzyme
MDMATPTIARLGHVGIHCKDLAKQKAFYVDVLGLHLTNEDPGMGMVFLSARPEEEDHELLLCGGREVDDVLLLQQMSWRCNDLTDVIGFYERLRAQGVQFDMIVSHGNAVGMYFRDPEENRLEIYWATGFEAKQPYLEKVDLRESPHEIMRKIKESVAQHGETGIVDTAALEGQDIHSRG